MTQSAYPAARAAAGRIRSHFVRHLATPSLPQGGEAAALPDTAAIEAIIEAAFWASLRREEGYMPRISLAFVAPETVESPLKFERPLPLAAQPLTRLAPAVERPGIHLGVWRDGEDLFVWGATRSLPAFCLVLEVIAPGLLVVKHSRGDESGKFVNIAVLQGDEIKMIDEQSARLPDCPDLLTSLLGFDSQHASSESVSVLIHLAVSMRAHGRGGSLPGSGGNRSFTPSCTPSCRLSPRLPNSCRIALPATRTAAGWMRSGAPSKVSPALPRWMAQP